MSNFGTQILVDPATGKPLLTTIGGTATSPIAVGAGAEGAGGLFGGAGGLATGIGIGALTGLLGKIIGGFNAPFGVGATTEADLKRQVDDWVASQNKPERENIPDPGYVLSGPVTTTYDIPGYGKVTGYPSTGGAVLTDVGMYDPNTGKVFGTPPMSPLPAPQAESVSGGGGGSSGGGASSGGGEVGSFDPDPDLILGNIPPSDSGAQPPEDVFGPIQTQTGTMPAPGPDGRPDPTLPPVQETTNTPSRTKEEWASIVKDWLIRFPNASDAEKQEAISKYGVPADVVAEAGQSSGGTGGTGGGNTGTGGGAGGTGTVPTVPVTPTVPTPVITDRPPVVYTGDPGRGTGVSVDSTGIGSGTGTGTGTGGGSGAGSGGGLLFGQNQRRTSELVFPELYKNEQKFTLLNNLLSYRPGAYYR